MTASTSLGAFSIAPLFGTRSYQLSIDASVTERGIRYDKTLALVTDDGRVLDRHTHPLLSRLKYTIDWCDRRGDYVVFKAPDKKDLRIRLDVVCGLLDSFTALHAGVEYLCSVHGKRASDWFSSVFGISCRLVQLLPWKPVLFDTGEHGAFPINFGGKGTVRIMAIKSLVQMYDWVRELKMGLLTGSDFRMNICLLGPEPFEEECLVGKRFKVGDVVFRALELAPCAETFDFNFEHETERPGHLIVDLLKEKRQSSTLYAGVNCVVETPGFIRKRSDLVVF